ncbi:MAG: SPFH domain-containing protein [Clostridiales bacterium]|nr:SPFH domain-containing protein [Clostridiales bacterium]
MGFLKNIELPFLNYDVVVQKFNLKGDVIKKGSTLTVRETQAAVFCDKGVTADVFGPGMYKLETNSLPIITKLLSWKYGFETPFKSEVYFVNTKEFTAVRWGTSNPVPVQTDLGVIRLRGHGSYAFKVTDPCKFLKYCGLTDIYYAGDVCVTLRSMLVGGISSAFGKLGLTLSDMTLRYKELSDAVKEASKERCNELGITLTAFDVENLSVPPELEKAVDESAKLGIMRGNMDVYTQMAQADALKEAAKHSATGTIVGVGAGMQLNNNMAGGVAAGAGATGGGLTCSVCHASITPGAKFCPECGSPLKKFSPECGSPVTPGAKFCNECGTKLQ